MKKSSKKRLGTLGEPEARRMVQAFYQDCKTRTKVAWVCGIGIGLALTWSQLAILYAMG